MKNVLFIFGTRPEAIKLCPLILAMKQDKDFSPIVCVTGQHREMLDQVLTVFNIKPDIDLGLMRTNQTLAAFTSSAVSCINDYLVNSRPDLVVVQGDTTTVFCGALAAFYNKIPVAHVEAGLRTWKKMSPYPEEINRVLTSRLADFHFAPTQGAKENLVKEGILEESITVTGNTVIDALFLTVDKNKKKAPTISGIPEGMFTQFQDSILITGHRRENFGEGFERICNAIVNLASIFPEKAFIYPVHLNPNVREPVYRLLSGKDNIFLISPLRYEAFVYLMDKSKLILTDSGGVQEEGPSLGKPVLVMRDTTERPEAVEIGTARLVGTTVDGIVSNVKQLLTDETAYRKMANAVNPYGDGEACKRILEALRK